MEFFRNALPLIYKKFLNILKRIYIDKTIVIHIIKAENAHSVAPIMAPRQLINGAAGINVTPSRANHLSIQQ